VMKFVVEGVCDGAFSRATQTCKPDYTALMTVQGLSVTARHLMFMPSDICIINHYMLLCLEVLD
jgi:hypothetical protein